MELTIGTAIAVVSSKRMKPPGKPQRPKPQKQSAKPPARSNPRLTEQTRKVLGKHYANRYGVK